MRKVTLHVRNNYAQVKFEVYFRHSMSSNNGNLTIRDRYRNAVKLFYHLENSQQREDLEIFQKLVASSLQEFIFLQAIVDNLSLFSGNEDLKEISTSYISFIAIPYYESCLYMKLLADISNGGFLYDLLDKIQHKLSNLQLAKVKLAEFLHQLESFGGILSEEQMAKLHSFKSSYDPSIEEITSLSRNPASRRAEKIANFKQERELRKKIEILDDYYSNDSNQEDVDDDIFKSLDEEVVRAIFIDQLKLYSLSAFENLDLIALELQVLLSRSRFENNQIRQQQNGRNEDRDEFGYTTKVEVRPNQAKKVSDLINKQGKILQPFTITNDRQEIKKKVFGTGQVLPSMTVEEYLDYELANGKLAKEDSNANQYSSDEDDSDKEIERREWDDWKDDHPKGSGNIKGNIG